ncbi:right-handed parallel beta-helix repeat-containing protein [Candidatus Bathyarchaeota archaeon]|nr:right-handed parallel beta-helix repeat-containing protein [Candidatus Bathyarchaeota archaeon]
MIVNKSISLVGNSNFSSIIDGGNIGTVLEITVSNVAVRGFRLQNSGYGWTRHGIYVNQAENCTIDNNYFLNDCHNIRLNYSCCSIVKGNIIEGVMTQPTMYGVRLENSVNCTVENNYISNCVGAIHLQNATNCVVLKNTVVKNSQGIRFYTPCIHNMVFANDFVDNSYDGMVSTMPDNSTFMGNMVFHNNFVNNSSPFIGTIYGFTWDNGYPSAGNYWSRYNGADLKSGRFQNETGYDGIGDTSYNVSQEHKDNYPLIHPYGSIVNWNTGSVFLTITSALAASETLNGHKIIVKPSVYIEHINLNKSISLIGENKFSTIIDGGNSGTVVTVSASNVTFAGFTVKNSGLLYPPYGNDCGLLLDHSSGCNVSFNIFKHNRIGAYLLFSTSNTLVENILDSNFEDGLLLWHSGNNSLEGNTLTNNTYNFGVFGSDFEDFNNNITASNQINDEPIIYIVNGANEIFDENEKISTIYLINCINMTVRNLQFIQNAQGVFCFNVTGSLFQNLTVSRNSYGLDFLRSNNNNVSNIFCENNWVRIRLCKWIKHQTMYAVPSKRIFGGQALTVLLELWAKFTIIPLV